MPKDDFGLRLDLRHDGVATAAVTDSFYMLYAAAVQYLSKSAQVRQLTWM